jgi:myo-inositol-1(or 4)-monophosphatase
VTALPEDLARLDAALDAAAHVLAAFTPGEIDVERKEGGSPVTEADYAVDRVLRATLPAAGEGWLSEETEDDPARLECSRVWIVDPIDGTRQFIAGVPEWGVSIGLAIDGIAVAGAFINPETGLRVIGGVGLGCTVNGRACRVTDGDSLAGCRVLASRSEHRRGEWTRFADRGFSVETVGSVAHKLAVVAAGEADATWTLRHKNEWDVAGGVALLVAAGGTALLPDGSEPRFNQPDPIVDGLLSGGKQRMAAIRELVEGA